MSDNKLPRCPVPGCGAEMKVMPDSDDTYYIIGKTSDGILPVCPHQYEMTESEYRTLCAKLGTPPPAEQRDVCKQDDNVEPIAIPCQQCKTGWIRVCLGLYGLVIEPCKCGWDASV
ncbi:MAG: hypothetical protein ABIH23_18955 [bacterium]